MSDPTFEAALPLLLAGGFGLLLGGAFYGGLWWTVRRGVASPRPALWFLVSGVARTGAALGVFWGVGQGHWERLAACLVGFLVGRLLVARWTGAAGVVGARVEAACES